MADATLAADFYARFRSEAQSLSQRIADFTISTGNRDTSREELMTAVAKLRRELVEATPYLPSYDQRQSELQMKRLEQQLDSTTNTGGMAKSGSRFSFKRPVRTPGNTSAAKEDGLATINTPGGSDIRSDQYLANATSTAVQREHEATKPSIKSSETNSSTDSADSLNFHNRSHEYITLPPAVSQNSDTKPHDKLSSGTEISLSSLSDCVVNLTAARTQIGVIRAFHVRDLRRCIIVMPYVEGSALIHSCEDCIIAVGCHQFRIHGSTRTDVYIYVTSTPILENCSAMRFAPYDLPEESLPADALQKNNQYDQVQDFLWLRSTPSPNWSLIPPNERLSVDWKELIAPSEDVDSTLKRLLPKHDTPAEVATSS